mgnify:CR=1 FL=1
MTDNQKLAERIITKLKDSLKHSTWFDRYEEAYDDLFVNYLDDIVHDVLAVIEAPTVQTSANSFAKPIRA